VWAQPASAPEWFEVEITTTAANQTYSWQITAGTAINATTEWGDGTSSTHTATGIYSKTYASAGVYTLRIQASFGSNGAFNMRPNTDRARLTRLLSPIPGFSGLTSLFSLCSTCAGLTGAIPVDFLRYATNVTILTNLFNGCAGLTGAIPVDFLRYATSAVTLQNLLIGCTGLTGAIPVDFLRYATNVTTYQSMLRTCPGIQIQPNIFGSDPSRFLDQSPNFTEMFRGTGVSTVQGTAPPMWTYDYGTGTPITTGAFSLQSTDSLSNYNDIPAGWL
jgi:hypothetical protein